MKTIQKRIYIFFMILAGVFIILSYPVFKMDFAICKQLLYAYLFVSCAIQCYNAYLKKSKSRYFYYVLMALLIILSIVLWK